jgi:hypothetical protein
LKVAIYSDLLHLKKTAKELRESKNIEKALRYNFSAGLFFSFRTAPDA